MVSYKIRDLIEIRRLFPAQSIKLVRVKNNRDQSNNRSTHFRDGQPQVQETYYPQTVISIYQFSDNKKKHMRFYVVLL